MSLSQVGVLLTNLGHLSEDGVGHAHSQAAAYERKIDVDDWTGLEIRDPFPIWLLPFAQFRQKSEWVSATNIGPGHKFRPHIDGRQNFLNTVERLGCN